MGVILDFCAVLLCPKGDFVRPPFTHTTHFRGAEADQLPACASASHAVGDSVSELVGDDVV